MQDFHPFPTRSSPPRLVKLEKWCKTLRNWSPTRLRRAQGISQPLQPRGRDIQHPEFHPDFWEGEKEGQLSMGTRDPFWQPSRDLHSRDFGIEGGHTVRPGDKQQLRVLVGRWKR